jgi:hypothetical protein
MEKQRRKRAASMSKMTSGSGTPVQLAIASTAAKPPGNEERTHAEKGPSAAVGESVSSNFENTVYAKCTVSC